jgi:hypothetical protein
MKRLAVFVALCGALVVAVALDPVLSQSRPAPRKRGPEELKRLSVAAETPGLAEPFRGITRNGQVESGLFTLKSTGVSTAPVRAAADAFLRSLTVAQRAKTLKPVDDAEWRKWMNQSFYVRDGVGFLEMTAAQRDAAFALLRAGLSARGLKQTRDIMRLNETLAELSDNNFDEYGEWQYFVTVMGTPSATEPWGWQFDGHHAIVNYFVLGDQVVMTPHFAGSEPVVATTGKYKGTSVMQDEQNKGLAFVTALTAEQRAKAILKSSKTEDLNLTEAWKDNVVLDYAGLAASALSPAQREQLLSLAGLYVGNMDDGHARVKMGEVRAHLDQTRFAWIGGTSPGSAFYYRIHSPVILIEFDHQRPVGLRHLMDPSVPNLAHIHTVVRTPNGNDYGKDLLRQHYLAHPHP